MGDASTRLCCFCFLTLPFHFPPLRVCVFQVHRARHPAHASLPHTRPMGGSAPPEMVATQVKRKGIGKRAIAKQAQPHRAPVAPQSPGVSGGDQPVDQPAPTGQGIAAGERPWPPLQPPHPTRPATLTHHHPLFFPRRTSGPPRSRCATGITAPTCSSR